MNYLVKFILTKEQNIDGKIVTETFPISLKSGNVSSKKEAIESAKKSFNGFYLGGSNDDAKYSIDVASLERIPEDPPILKPNYYELYKSQILEFKKKSEEKGINKITLNNGNTIYLRKSVYSKDDEEFRISDGCTYISYNTKKDTVTFCTNISILSSLDAEYKKDGTIEYTNTGFHGELSSRPIEEIALHSGYYDTAKQKQVEAFVKNLPMFSKEGIAKRQAKIQEEYAKKFYQEQLALIEKEEMEEKN